MSEYLEFHAERERQGLPVFHERQRDALAHGFAAPPKPKTLIPGAGAVFIVPESKSRDVGGLMAQVSEKSLPRGRVVLVGECPPHLFRPGTTTPINDVKVGDVVVYGRASANDVSVNLDGQDVSVKVIHMRDVLLIERDASPS